MQTHTLAHIHIDICIQTKPICTQANAYTNTHTHTHTHKVTLSLSLSFSLINSSEIQRLTDRHTIQQLHTYSLSLSLSLSLLSRPNHPPSPILPPNQTPTCTVRRQPVWGCRVWTDTSSARSAWRDGGGGGAPWCPHGARGTCHAMAANSPGPWRNGRPLVNQSRIWQPHNSISSKNHRALEKQWNAS